MALELELDILPVTIIDSYKILRKGFLNLVPGRAGLVVHPSIPIAQFKDNIENLMIESRKILESGQLTVKGEG